MICCSASDKSEYGIGSGETETGGLWPTWFSGRLDLVTLLFAHESAFGIIK